MRRFIFIIAILILSVWLGLRISEDPGLAFFSYRDWSVETPLWFAVIAFVVVLLIFYFLMQLFEGVDHSFERWRNWRKQRRKYRSYSKTNRGLLELVEGNWRNAETCLLEGIDQSDAPLVNYLAAAKAAHERGAYDKRDMYLRKAHDVSPRADVVIGLTQAHLQFRQGQLEQALATLQRIRAQAPLQKAALKLLQRLYIRLADWQNLLKLLPSLRKVNLITAEQCEQLEKNIYQELLAAVKQKNEGLAALRTCWSTIPRRLQKCSELMSAYARQLAHYPNTTLEVDELIQAVLKKTWDNELVELYGLLISSQPQKQLAMAEKWLKYYGHQAMLLLTLGRLSMQCQLWGKARSYLQESLKLGALPETYETYGKLFEQLGDTSLALQNYRDGLALLVNNKIKK